LDLENHFGIKTKILRRKSRVFCINGEFYGHGHKRVMI